MVRNDLIENRVIELLTKTNLTFKEIVTKLESENMAASIGVIRRINRNNRYRQPRYDSKLSPSQRSALVQELRDSTGLKPNLSLIAKRYGVCHGSVWYWWDKLKRIKEPGKNPKKSSAKRHEDLTDNPNYETIGNVTILTSDGPMVLPIMMFAKKTMAAPNSNPTSSPNCSNFAIVNLNTDCDH